MTNQMKVTEQYFHVVPFVSLNIQLISFVKLDAVYVQSRARAPFEYLFEQKNSYNKSR